VDFDQPIPLFPLPNVVLYPRAVLPLHVFEQRYRAMMRDTLDGSNLLAMALLRPGYEATYHTPDAEIHPFVCVGRILRVERLPDGRYHCLLRGIIRARVLREDKRLCYRRGFLEPVPADNPAPERLRELRGKMLSLLASPPLLELAVRGNWVQLLRRWDASLSDTVDLLASAMLPTIEQKQSFLEEHRVEVRVHSFCNMLRQARNAFVMQRQTERAKAQSRNCCDN